MYAHTQGERPPLPWLRYVVTLYIAVTGTIPLAVNHESEVTMWSSSIKDLERQQDRLARVSILPSPTSSPHTGNMAISLH